MLSMFPALSYLSELLRGLAGLLFEQAGEVLGVLEAEGVGYLADGVGGRSRTRCARSARWALPDVRLGLGQNSRRAGR